MDNYIEVVLHNNYCIKYGLSALLEEPSSIRPILTEDFDLEDFCQIYKAYFVNSKGELERDEQKAIEERNELLKEQLRFQRKNECFSVVNRGKLWYDNLSPSQLNELQTWYQAWLDVTETLQIPKAPAWINEQ